LLKTTRAMTYSILIKHNSLTYCNYKINEVNTGGWNAMEMGERIKALRKQNGLTLKELGAKLAFNNDDIGVN